MVAGLWLLAKCGACLGCRIRLEASAHVNAIQTPNYHDSYEQKSCSL